MKESLKSLHHKNYKETNKLRFDFYLKKDPDLLILPVTRQPG